MRNIGGATIGASGALRAEDDGDDPGASDADRLQGLMFEDLELGLRAEMTKTITQDEIDLFARISGDHNPIHVDRAYAAQTMFQSTIAHGFLTGSLISSVFGMKLPGPGAIYISQTMNFRAPVLPGDEITAAVEVAELYVAKKRAKFDCACTNQHGKLVLRGEAILMVPARDG